VRIANAYEQRLRFVTRRSRALARRHAIRRDGAQSKK
jgi:hypothetical protein